MKTMKAVAKTINDIADSICRIGEWCLHTRIWDKKEYQPVQEEIILAIQKLYNKRKLNDNLQTIDNTCLIYDSKEKQPKYFQKTYQFKDRKTRLLESATNSICRDIDDLSISRKNRILNAVYPNIPLLFDLSCYYGGLCVPPTKILIKEAN